MNKWWKYLEKVSYGLKKIRFFFIDDFLGEFFKNIFKKKIIFQWWNLV